jgi:hypothetical protein
MLTLVQLELCFQLGRHLCRPCFGLFWLDLVHLAVSDGNSLSHSLKTIIWVVWHKNSEFRPKSRGIFQIHRPSVSSGYRTPKVDLPSPSNIPEVLGVLKGPLR